MAYTFSAASTQYLSTPDAATLDITGAITLAAWIKSSGSYASNRGIVSKYVQAGNQRSYIIYLEASGFLGFALSTDGTFQPANVITSTSAVGTDWAHVAGVFNPSTRQESFVNGVSAALKTSSVAASIYSGSADLWIGNQFTVGVANNNFDGAICEAGIWSTALAADEIASLSKGVACRLIRPQSLVFYAPLIRDLIDVRGGRAITNNNTATVSVHPRVYA